MGKPIKLIAYIAVCEAVGLAATPFTLAAIPTWYQGLQKPAFSPPNWVFAPVWTTLYLLMGISVYLVAEKNFKNQKVKIALYYFFAQLFFNFIWSILFFGLHSPLLGLIDIILLWILILLTIIKFFKISKLSAYLLIPYLAWVSLATALNFFVLILN